MSQKLVGAFVSLNGIIVYSKYPDKVRKSVSRLDLYDVMQFVNESKRLEMKGKCIPIPHSNFIQTPVIPD